MPGYRVSRVNINRPKDNAIDHKTFDFDNQAEEYALDRSSNDPDHSYIIEKEVDHDEYQITKIYKGGLVVGEIK